MTWKESDPPRTKKSNQCPTAGKVPSSPLKTWPASRPALSPFRMKPEIIRNNTVGRIKDTCSQAMKDILFPPLLDSLSAKCKPVSTKNN